MNSTRTCEIILKQKRAQWSRKVPFIDLIDRPTTTKKKKERKKLVV